MPRTGPTPVRGVTGQPITRELVGPGAGNAPMYPPEARRGHVHRYRSAAPHHHPGHHLHLAGTTNPGVHEGPPKRAFFISVLREPGTRRRVGPVNRRGEAG